MRLVRPGPHVALSALRRVLTTPRRAVPARLRLEPRLVPRWGR
eukprot:SAG11_NODE_4813_length_1757_cov_7.884198_1_plen_42_part_10